MHVQSPPESAVQHPPLVPGVYDVIKWCHLIGGANMKSFTLFKQKLWINLQFLGQHKGEIYRK